MSSESDRLREIHRHDGLLYGLPTKPVVSVPKMNVVGAKAHQYEGRTYTNSGLAIVSKQNPAEAAVNMALRPGTTMVEVGQYEPEDGYDLVHRLGRPLQTVLVNGKQVNCEQDGTLGVIRRVAASKGAKRMVTHEVDQRLPQIAKDMGLELKEDADKFAELGTKSGLNSALYEHCQKHPESKLKPFGVNVRSIGDMLAEVQRLRSHGAGTYIKLDTVGGIVAAGGEGHLAIPLDMDISEAARKIRDMAGQGEFVTGVAQMMLTDYKVLSLSSGQLPDGRFVAYEAHEQTVDGNTADGARPIADKTIFNKLWDMWQDIKVFYEESGITGDQNLNIMCLSDEDYALACQLYGEQNVADMLMVDFNYRAISGTKNAMCRYQEDTGNIFGFDQDFRSRGIRVAPAFAANPHLMFAAGRHVGLKAGKGGNFTVVNMGTFTPSAVRDAHFRDAGLKTQVIAQLAGASRIVDAYEEMLMGGKNAQRLAQEQNLQYIDPAAISELPYGEIGACVYGGMQEVLSYNQNHEKANDRSIQGRIWRRS